MKYLRCVASIDENIGRLMKYLDSKKLTENTIIVYTSDQGFYLGEHGMYDKRFMYEESLRIPFIVRFPASIKAGSLNKDIITNIDFAETFLDYAGIDIPSGMQGRSLRLLFEGQTPADWQQMMYYRYWMHGAHFNIPAHYGIRTQQFKLIYFYGKGLGFSYDEFYPSGDWETNGNIITDTEPYWEMYDLKNDPNELDNIYNDPKYSADLEKLKKLLHQLKEQYDDKDDKYPELQKGW
jgi:arylsulfatase A-like enzyme